MPDDLDRSKGASPLYHQLEMLLRKSIEQGEYKKGDILPAEREICASYGLSRITVRQAISNLAADGYVQGRPGIGTVVTYSRITESPGKVASLSEEMRKHGIEMSTVFCSAVLRIPPKEILDNLGLPDDSVCLELVRTRAADGSPLVFSKTYISEKWGLPADASRYMHSLYEFISQEKGIHLSYAEDTFEAVLSDREIEENLKLKESDAVLKRSRKSYVGNEVFEYTESFYRSSRYRYTVISK